MKKIKLTSILPLIALLMMLAAGIPAYADGDAKIKFKETVFDFGEVSLKGGKVSHEFTFTNDGKKNLVITNARADCGCTRPEYSDAPVAPGKSGKLKVTFVPAGEGHFSKKVTVTTNGNPRKVRLLIKGEVVK